MDIDRNDKQGDRHLQVEEENENKTTINNDNFACKNEDYVIKKYSYMHYVHEKLHNGGSK